MIVLNMCTQRLMGMLYLRIRTSFRNMLNSLIGIMTAWFILGKLFEVQTHSTPSPPPLPEPQCIYIFSSLYSLEHGLTGILSICTRFSCDWEWSLSVNRRCLLHKLFSQPENSSCNSLSLSLPDFWFVDLVFRFMLLIYLFLRDFFFIKIKYIL